jgi:hypothetical protein
LDNEKDSFVRCVNHQQIQNRNFSTSRRNSDQELSTTKIMRTDPKEMKLLILWKVSEDCMMKTAMASIDS